MMTNANKQISTLILCPCCNTELCAVWQTLEHRHGAALSLGNNTISACSDVPAAQPGS